MTQLLASTAAFARMTKQELFNTSAKHVLKNGRPSINSKRQCRYAGIGCAAAPFLKPSMRAALDTQNVVWTALVGNGKVSPHHRLLVQELQGCHDNPALTPDPKVPFIKRYKEGMRRLAAAHKLDASVLDEPVSV